MRFHDILRKKLLEIWKDPVWSKVISAGMIGIILQIYNEFKDKFKGLGLIQQIQVFARNYIIVLVILFVVFYVYRKIIKQKNNTNLIAQDLVSRYKDHQMFKTIFGNNYTISTIQIKLNEHLPEYGYLLQQLKKDGMLEADLPGNPGLNDLGKRVFDTINN